MTEVLSQIPENSPSVLEARRIFEQHGPPLTREAAAEVLKSRGILPPGADGKPVYTPPVADPAAYVALEQKPDGTLNPDRAGAAEWAAALGADPMLGRVLVDDIKGAGDVDPAAVSRALEGLNRDPKQTYSDAEFALARAAQKTGKDWVKPTALPLRSLVMLADHGRLLRRRSA